MSTALETLEELPRSYPDEMTRASVKPLWPSMRNVLPHGQPNPLTKSHRWAFQDVRPLLLKAGELTPSRKRAKATFSVPVFAEVGHEAAQEAFLIRIHDTPLQDKLGSYKERIR